MRNQKTKTFFGLAAAALVALAMTTSFDGTALAGSPTSPTTKLQVQKSPTVSPRPTSDPQASGDIRTKPVVIRDHAWVQFYNVKTGENTGCHDIDNQTSCEGTCPCQ